MKFAFTNIYVAESFEGISPIHYENKEVHRNGKWETIKGYFEGRTYRCEDTSNRSLWRYVQSGLFFIPTGVRYFRIRNGKLIEFIVRAVHYQYEEGRYNTWAGYNTIFEIVYPDGSVVYEKHSGSFPFPFFKSVEHYAECACGENTPYEPIKIENFFESFVGFDKYADTNPNQTPNKGFAWRYKMDTQKGLVRKPCGFYEIVVIGNDAYVILDVGNSKSAEDYENAGIKRTWYLDKSQCIKENMATEIVAFGDDGNKLSKVKVDVVPVPKVPKIIQIRIEE